MIWAVVVAAGIGLLAGAVLLRVPFLVLASVVTVAAGAALTPAGWWPFWGVAYVTAMLCSLQFAYLAGYLVACAVSRLKGEGEDSASVSERLNVRSAGGWFWPSGTDCTV